MVDKNELLNQLKRLEQWNNSDVPKWVVDVINGMPDVWELMTETRICNSVKFCEDCPRYADDCDGNPDMMRGEDDA